VAEFWNSTGLCADYPGPTRSSSGLVFGAEFAEPALFTQVVDHRVENRAAGDVHAAALR
jgi:hypothetical protein